MKIKTVHGQVAKDIHNHGDVSFNVLKVDLQRSCAQEGAHGRFLALAKDELPLSCHDQLEWLVKHSDIHARCLLLACKNKALVCKDGRLVRGVFMPDYVLCTVMIAVVGLFGTLSAWAWLAYKPQLSQINQFILFGITAACVIAVWWMQQQFFYPHQIACKALAALQTRSHGKDSERLDG